MIFKLKKICYINNYYSDFIKADKFYSYKCKINELLL